MAFLPQGFARSQPLITFPTQVRVISVPCWSLLEEQPREYRETLLPPQVLARVSVEAASELGWAALTGPCGEHVGMFSFGASGPHEALYRHFGITAEGVVEAAGRALARSRRYRAAICGGPGDRHQVH